MNPAEARLAYSIVRKITARDDLYLDLEHNDVCIDGWVRLTDPELALMRRLAHEPTVESR